MKPSHVFFRFYGVDEADIARFIDHMRTTYPVARVKRCKAPCSVNPFRMPDVEIRFYGVGLSQIRQDTLDRYAELHKPTGGTIVLRKPGDLAWENQP